MNTILNRRFVSLLAAGATLAMAALVGASSSTQVKELSPLVVPRTAHVATALTDGRILITGGRDSAGNIVAVSEIFDPATETSTASATLTTPRVDHTATLLPNGKVLVAGGTGASGSVNSAEIFDPSNPAAGFRMLSATMGAARARHTATLLNSGQVLIARGDTAGTAEIFDPATESFSSALLAMAAPRSGQTATELSGDKKILVAGGVNAQNLSVNPALFNAARIWTDKDDYLPGDNVILSGSGWKPNENVYLYAVDDTTDAWTYGSTVTADANGGFVVAPYFIVQLVQQGAHFSVTAVGAQSAMQADVKF